MTILDAEQVVDLLREVVAEKGEGYVYPHVPNTIGGVGCRYEYEGAPSCLVGHVLYRAGWSVEALKSLDESGSSAQDLWYLNLPEGVGVVTKAAAEVLEKAQIHQDDGDSWGFAVREAIKVANGEDVYE